MNAQIIINWLEDGVHLNVPATDDEIFNCEQSIGFRFPLDFNNFYKQINGFKDWGSDGEMLSLWPLAKIVAEYDQSMFIGFCDYLIYSHLIGFLKTKEGIYKAYGVDDMPVICNTFTEFLEHWKNKTMKYI